MVKIFASDLEEDTKLNEFKYNDPNKAKMFSIVLRIDNRTTIAHVIEECCRYWGLSLYDTLLYQVHDDGQTGKPVYLGRCESDLRII